MNPTGADLDHVAIATTDIAGMLDALVGDLGGTVFHGGDGDGFRWMQTRLGDGTTGMTIESLVVWEPARNDFLERFIARTGGGAHHITFKVPDLPAMLERCRDFAVPPVNVSLENPSWREAFLMPHHAQGTVVQLAQTDETWEIAEALTAVATDGPWGEPRWWPTPPPAASPPTTLDAVVLGSPDRAGATRFFTELLDGTVVAEDATATLLRWPGGGQIRIEDASDRGVVRLDAHGSVARTVTVSGVPFVVA